jgi:2-polyprenyl-3-methyl-5-hydroxy-6-metoxy-1,4-benzoquinol methylase
MKACPYCNSTEQAGSHRIGECMFGLGEAFDYAECARCGSLRILNPPQDLARYYPSNYYSFASLPDGGLLRRWLHRRHFTATVRPRSPSSLLDRAVLGRRGELDIARYLKLAGVGPSASILDVGCGSGGLVRRMRAGGCTNVTGIDPYLELPQVNEHGLRILKRSAAALDETFDFVMYNHVLEHVADPMAELHVAWQLIRPGGSLLLRTPVADSHAWRHFGVHWVQLDAPRHLTIPTTHGLQAAVSRIGFRVEAAERDSNAFQFWGSELARAGTPIMRAKPDERSPPPFDARTMARFARESVELNRRQEGDQACLYLRRPR